MTGARSANLGNNMLLKLKAVYSLTEKLYAGTLKTLVAVSCGRKPPTIIKEVLDNLSTVPAQISELKLSAARAGAITALSRAKAWQVELDPAEMAGGCPEFKDNGTAFDEADFARCVKEMRPLACQLAQGLDLNKYQPAYDSLNIRVKPPSHPVTDLTPQRRKQLFAPELDPSIIINEEATFEALMGIDWTSDDLQMADNEEPAQDDPARSSSKQQKD